MTEFTVVGGGIAGLVVARRLALLGNGVDIVEATDRLGGSVAHQRVGGVDLDAGATSFPTRGGHVPALASELGLADDVVFPARTDRWLQPTSGAAVPLPTGSILGIPGTPLAADVIAAIGTPAALRAQLDAITPSLRSPTNRSLADLVRRRMGRGMLDRLVTPAVIAEYGLAPQELPADQVPGLLAALGREGSLASAVRYLLAGAGERPRASIRGGLSRLVTELVADLESLEVGFEFGRRVSSPDEFDNQVVLAAPLADQPGKTVVLATLVFDAPVLNSAPRGTGLVVAGHRNGVRALRHLTAEWDWISERAGGRHVLMLSYDEEPEDLEAAALTDAERLLGVRLGQPEAFARSAWTRSPVQPATVGTPAVGGGDLATAVRRAEELAVELARA